MPTTQLPICTETQYEVRSSQLSRVGKMGRGIMVAAALAAVSLTAIPQTAQAHGPGAGAAIGLGILGGVLAGAAIAAAAPPAYAPPPAYYYPRQAYYYHSAPDYYYRFYYPPRSYYGPALYRHPPYDYDDYR